MRNSEKMMKNSMKGFCTFVLFFIGFGTCRGVNIPIPVLNGDFETPILVEDIFNPTVYFWTEASSSEYTDADLSGSWMPENFSQMLRMGSSGSVSQDLNHHWTSTDQYTLTFDAFEVAWFAQPGETGEAVTVQLCQIDDTVLWSQSNISLDQTLSGDENAFILGPVNHEFSFLIDASTFSTETEGNQLRLRFLESGTAGAIWIDNITFTLHTSVIPTQNNGLICHWKLDETTGTTAIDSSSSGNNGTLNGTTFDTGSTTGKVSNCLYFDGNTNGSDDWVTKSLSTGTWAAYSLSFWVKAQTTGQVNYSSVFNNYDNSNHGFQIDVDGATPGNYRYHGSVDMNFGVVTTGWVHLAAVCNGSNTRLFYNGNYAGTVAASDNTFSRLELGVNRNRNQRFQGYIDDFQIYDEILSDAQILSLYQNPGSIIDLSEPTLTPQIYSFNADDGYIESPAVINLQWQLLGADTIIIDQGIGDVASLTSAEGIGSTTVSINQTTTFTLTASNANGVETAEVTVTVGPARPNIVLFVVDDMGTQDTSVPFHYVNGNPQPTANNSIYRTPGMERLADSGMIFTSCYAMPVCSPTRVCLMTGLNSFRHRTTDWLRQDGGTRHTRNHRDLDPPLNWAGTGILPDHITLPQVLSNAGYSTIFCGKAHLGSQGSYGEFPDNIGFDVNIAGYYKGSPSEGSYYNYSFMPLMSAYSAIPSDNTGIFLTEALTCEAKKYIEQAVDADTPFFVNLSHYAVHSPFTKDIRFDDNYTGGSPFSEGSNAEKFATMIEGMDKSLDDVLDKLEELGVAEETLILFMGDNGSDNPYGGNSNSNPLRGKKGNKYEGGVRVPLLISWAKNNPANPFQQALSIPSGSVEEDMVACFDLYPTILEAAGISISHPIDGHPLTEYLKATPGIHRPQELLIHYPHDHNSDYFTIYRQGDYKLIYSYDENSILDTFDAANDDNQITPSFELYNLVIDVGESNDLSGSDPGRVTAMANSMARELNTALPLWPVLEGSSIRAPVDSALLCNGRADLNCDDSIDPDDLVLIAEVWLSNGFVGDFIPNEGDGIVDLSDLAGLALQWLQ